MKMTFKTILSLMLAVSFTGLAHVRADESSTTTEKVAIEKTIQDLNIEQARLSAISEKFKALRIQKELLTASDVALVLISGYAAYGAKKVGEMNFDSGSKFKALGGMTSKVFSYISYGYALTNLINAGVDLKKVYLGDAEMQSIFADIQASQVRIATLQEVLSKVK